MAMQMMRHSDIRLTNRTYTDAALLPMTEALEKLPRYETAKAEMRATGTDSVQTPNDTVTIAAQIAAQLRVCQGRGKSRDVTGIVVGGSDKTPVNIDPSRDLSQSVAAGLPCEESWGTRIRT